MQVPLPTPITSAKTASIASFMAGSFLKVALPRLECLTALLTSRCDGHHEMVDFRKMRA